jgi:hypothetical protein
VLPIDPIQIGSYSFDRNVFNMLMAIGLVTWTRIARAVRGEVLSLKNREFVEAAHANWRFAQSHHISPLAAQRGSNHCHSGNVSHRQ